MKVYGIFIRNNQQQDTLLDRRVYVHKTTAERAKVEKEQQDNHTMFITKELQLVESE